MDALSPAQLLQQETESRLAHFDFSTAWALGRHLHDRAAERGAPVAIEVYAFGQVLFLSALPGSVPDNLEWMRRKRNTVLRYGHSSMYVGMMNQQRGEAMAQYAFLSQSDYTDHGGSFPLLNSSGAVLGAVSISGLPSEEDHALALWGIQQVGRQGANSQ